MGDDETRPNETAGDEPPGASPPVRVQTWCHDCEGKGARWMPRAAMLQNLAAMAAQMQRCNTCNGSGRLPGLQPPL